MSYYADDLLTLYLGDCVEVMRELPAASVDAVVTDPPYGLGFMGKAWDSQAALASRPPSADETDERYRNVYPRTGKGPKAVAFDAIGMQAWHEAWAREALRVAKPGAHLLAFGGTRTYHRLASAIEDAGWEIRDCLVWAYASGFPKSLDVGKAIDKAAGAERTVTGSKAVTRVVDSEIRRTATGLAGTSGGGHATAGLIPVTAPATPDAAKWDGWGTALKPAWEPIVLARKPLRGTVAANVLEHGTGALNIGATRIAAPENDGVTWTRGGKQQGASLRTNTTGENEYVESHPAGRWPANLILTDPIFDGGVPGVVGGGAANGSQPIERPDGFQRFDGTDYNGGEAYQTGAYTSPGYGDSGTYSRFFLIAKSSRSDREPIVYPDGHEKGKRFSTHPTVKPIELMRHLVRLVTPPGGTVLDCFLGSGTTAIAANAEGFRCIGIEREQEYLDIAVARLAHQPLGLGLDVAAPTRKRSSKESHGAGWPKGRPYSQNTIYENPFKRDEVAG
jgi:DNA modification methylase